VNKPTPMQVMGAAVALSFVVGGGGLASGYAEAHSQAHAVLVAEQRVQAEQRAAGVVLGAKLCSTFGTLAALKPPAGDPKTNPSRAYEQEEHAALVQLGTDLGCKGG
jgi:hypothetical protein